MSVIRAHMNMGHTLRILDKVEAATWYKIGGGPREKLRIGKYIVNMQDNDLYYHMTFCSNDNKPYLVAVIDRTDMSAIIDQNEYYRSCKDGLEDDIELVKIAIDIIKTHKIQYIDLVDRIYIKCEDIHISFDTFHFLNHGCTWYEKHFGFKPQTQEWIDEYDIIKETYKNISVEELAEYKNRDCKFYTSDKVRNFLNKYNISHIGIFNWRLYL